MMSKVGSVLCAVYTRTSAMLTKECVGVCHDHYVLLGVTFHPLHVFVTLKSFTLTLPKSYFCPEIEL